MNSTPELLSSFETLLSELEAKQKQLQATQADLKTRQYAADAKLGDTSIPFDARVQERISIELLVGDAKRQAAERDVISTQVARAAGEVRSNLRTELSTKKYARMREITAGIEHDFVTQKLPFPANVIACQHRSLLPWDALSNGLSVATRPGDDWHAFVLRAKEALTAVSA